jgi:hypothetical protein
MARKDDILKSFLTHELLENKYELNQEELPKIVREALNSDIPIVKAMALIIEGLEKSPPITDTALNTQIRQYLQDNAL